MNVADTLYYLSDEILFIPFLFILIGSIVLTFKLNFIQFRGLGAMVRLLAGGQKASTAKHKVRPTRALFVAMSTTIGIGNIVAPIFAIGFGGPGALLGFLLATIFGGAATYAEAVLAVKTRERYKDGSIKGGPMMYLSLALHPAFSFLYAALCVPLFVSWTSNQSNQLAVLIEPLGVERWVVGLVLAALTPLLLAGGIKRVGLIAAKVVPVMFVLYTGGLLWILWLTRAQLAHTIWLVFASAFTTKALGGAGVGVGIQRALRWGLAKGVQSNESGVGTSAIAHATADVDDPVEQGLLSMISVYTNGLLCILTGLVVITSGVWQDPTLSFDIVMAERVFFLYFSSVGSALLVLSATLFAFTTIMGNSYYGMKCFAFTTSNRYGMFHHLLVMAAIFLGAVLDARFVWSVVDFFLIPVAIPNMIGIVVLVFKKTDLFRADHILARKKIPSV